MAANVIHDPMAPVMQAYIDSQRESLPAEIVINQTEATPGDKDREVVNMVHKVDSSNATIATRMQLDEQEDIEDKALSVAYSIRSTGTNDDSSGNSSQKSTISQLAQKRAVNIFQAEKDQDMNSLGNESHQPKAIGNVIQHDDASQASTLTDITNNTANQRYYNESDQSVSSKGSSLSIKSLKLSDLNELITPDMTREEVENSISTAMALQYKRQKDRMFKYVEELEQKKRQMKLLEDNDQNEVNSENQTNDMVRGTQKDGTPNSDETEENKTHQSGSNWDAARSK